MIMWQSLECWLKKLSASTTQNQGLIQKSFTLSGLIVESVKTIMWCHHQWDGGFCLKMNITCFCKSDKSWYTKKTEKHSHPKHVNKPYKNVSSHPFCIDCDKCILFPQPYDQWDGRYSKVKKRMNGFLFVLLCCKNWSEREYYAFRTRYDTRIFESVTKGGWYIDNVTHFAKK